MKKVILITGPRNCGKSEAIEAILSKYDNRIYIATLWNLPEFSELIARHQRRRDKKWHVFECQNNNATDFHFIKQKLFQIPKPAYCLVDGLTTLAINYGRKAEDYIDTARSLSYSLIDLIGFNQDVNWILIDVCPSVFLDNKIFEIVNLIIHRMLKDYIKSLIIYKWPKEYKNVQIPSFMD